MRTVPGPGAAFAEIVVVPFEQASQRLTVDNLAGVRTRGLLATAVVCSLVLAVVGPAWAGTAQPTAITVDCALSNGVTATTVTGLVGDTFMIDNTSGTDGCTFTGTTGVVTATNLTSGVLPAGTASTLTIVSAGSFTVTPRATSGGGTAASMTIIIGDPQPVAEYSITFDANGGTCSSNPSVVTAAAGDWYAMPTDGTSPYQCHRDDYSLVGWSRGSTLQSPGADFQLPDLPLASASADGSGLTHAQAHDHTTLYARWVANGVEITYDANVAAGDACLDANGENLPVSQRSTTVVAYPSVDQVASAPPCVPPDHVFTAWGISPQGRGVYAQGEDVATLGGGSTSLLRLYAMWDPVAVNLAATPCRDFMQMHPVRMRPTSMQSEIIAAGGDEQDFGLETQVICPRGLGTTQVVVYINGPTGPFAQL